VNTGLIDAEDETPKQNPGPFLEVFGEGSVATAAVDDFIQKRVSISRC
jgi:hypothetical protein